MTCGHGDPCHYDKCYYYLIVASYNHMSLHSYRFLIIRFLYMGINKDVPAPFYCPIQKSFLYNSKGFDDFLNLTFHHSFPGPWLPFQGVSFDLYTQIYVSFYRTLFN